MWKNRFKGPSQITIVTSSAQVDEISVQYCWTLIFDTRMKVSETYSCPFLTISYTYSIMQLITLALAPLSSLISLPELGQEELYILQHIELIIRKILIGNLSFPILDLKCRLTKRKYVYKESRYLIDKNQSSIHTIYSTILNSWRNLMTCTGTFNGCAMAEQKGRQWGVWMNPSNFW